MDTVKLVDYLGYAIKSIVGDLFFVSFWVGYFGYSAELIVAVGGGLV